MFRRVLAGAAVLAMLAVWPARAATKTVDLDAQTQNGAESQCDLNVLSTFPVRIENVVTNKAVGEAFDFFWMSAGPGGFGSSVTSGTTGGVGARWVWTTNQSVYAYSGNSCDRDICFVKTQGPGPTGGTCSLGCLNDGVSLTMARGTGGAVALSWTGGTAAYSVFRSPLASRITAPENLLASTSLLQSSDIPPAGSVFFYRVRGSSCNVAKPCGSATDCSAANGEGICVSRGPFSVPGRSLSSTDVTVSSASLTSSLITFFSPPTEIFRVTSTAQPGGTLETVSNSSNDPVTFVTEEFPPGCCPEPHQFRCGDTCVDALSDPENCGACGNVCGEGSCCSGGECVSLCPPGRIWCDGACIDPTNDYENCGACGNACGDEACCVEGGCESLCELGRTYCDGLCFELTLDRNNCGACGNVCDEGSVCSDGACVPCDEGEAVCGNLCVDLSDDPFNCGSCGNDCNVGCPPGMKGVCGSQEQCVCAPGTPLPRPPGSISTPTDAFCRNIGGDTEPTEEFCPSFTPEGPIEGEAPLCTVSGTTTTVPPGETATICRPGGLLFKEVSSQVSVCGDSIPGPDGACGAGTSNVTTGTFMRLVPDNETPIVDALVTPMAIQATNEPGRDGLVQPGETASLFIKVLNAGPVSIQNAVATLESELVDLTDDGVTNPVRITVVNPTQSYGTILGTTPTAQCEAPELNPATNTVAFRVEVPASFPGDTVSPLKLHFTGTVGGQPYAMTVPVSLGIADVCNYAAKSRDFDGIDGLSNPMTRLVPEGEDVPFPNNGLNAGSTAPLKMRLLCGASELRGEDVDAPEIVGLSEATRGKIDIDAIVLDDDTGTSNPFFRYNTSTKRWIFNMRTSQLGTGVFTLTIRIAGRKDYVTGFELE